MQDLRLPGIHVDVNLHPTKREVGFLHQDQLIDALTAAIEQKLVTSNAQYVSRPSTLYGILPKSARCRSPIATYKLFQLCCQIELPLPQD